MEFRKCYAVFIMLLFFVLHCSSKANDEVYLFSYFTGNGKDGLHMAYSYDGIKWLALKEGKSFLRPTAGKDKLMRDPCIIQGPDGSFHMVWTVSWNEKGIGYANSADLIHWSEQKYLPVMEHEKGARNCWAPEIFYDDQSEHYMIIWSTTIQGRYPETDTSGDNGYNHRMYFTTTRDFKAFTPTAVFYNHGFNVIDGTLIKENENYVLFLKDETRYPPEKNIRIAISNNLTGPYSEPSEPVTDKYWAEGPTAVKSGNEWIVYFDKYVEGKMGAIKSADLLKWTDISDVIDFPEGTRHGSVFKVPLSVLERLK